MKELITMVNARIAQGARVQLHINDNASAPGYKVGNVWANTGSTWVDLTKGLGFETFDSMEYYRKLSTAPDYKIPVELVEEIKTYLPNVYLFKDGMNRVCAEEFSN